MLMSLTVLSAYMSIACHWWHTQQTIHHTFAVDVAWDACLYHTCCIGPYKHGYFGGLLCWHPLRERLHRVSCAGVRVDILVESHERTGTGTRSAAGKYRVFYCSTGMNKCVSLGASRNQVPLQ
eukprot:GHRR01036052.1.p1 GENE.GHRR01036052.1~~GHRR01036052.1.p1  ORF type:complete len:123 (+),score=11.55 GHRR01036052.1:166-534(+)